MPSKTKTALEKTLRRNTHRRWILEVYRKHPLSPSASEPRKAVREFLLWVVAKIAKGERVPLFGVGVIHATFRKGRTIPTRLHGKKRFSVQPDQYVLKITPTLAVKDSLKKLAKTHPDPKTVFLASNANDPILPEEPSEI